MQGHLPATVRCAHLEINRIYAVVNDATLVGLAVSRLNDYCAVLNRCMVREIHRVIILYIV